MQSQSGATEIISDPLVIYETLGRLRMCPVILEPIHRQPRRRLARVYSQHAGLRRLGSPLTDMLANALHEAHTRQELVVACHIVLTSTLVQRHRSCHILEVAIPESGCKGCDPRSYVAYAMAL